MPVRNYKPITNGIPSKANGINGQNILNSVNGKHNHQKIPTKLPNKNQKITAICDIILSSFLLSNM